MKTIGATQAFLFCMLMLAAGVTKVQTKAGEIVSMAGLLEIAPAGQFFSSHFLRDPNNGALIVGLRDPGQRLLTSNTRVTVVAETMLEPDVNGLPILRVISLLPEYWAQPSIWTDQQKLPGTFSGHPKGPKPKDFAGAPFTSYRAYENDNGWEQKSLSAPDATTLTPPLRIDLVSLNTDVFVGSFEASAGLTYEIQFLGSLEETPVTLGTLTPGASGPTAITAPREPGAMGFYLLRAVSLFSP